MSSITFATVLLVITTISLIRVLYEIAPLPTTICVSIVTMFFTITSGHAWYTRRNITESIHILTTPLGMIAELLWQTSEKLRRDEPPTNSPNNATNTDTTVETVKQQYVTGEINTELQLEEKLEDAFDTNHSQNTETTLEEKQMK